MSIQLKWRRRGKKFARVSCSWDLYLEDIKNLIIVAVQPECYEDLEKVYTKTLLESLVRGQLSISRDKATWWTDNYRNSTEAWELTIEEVEEWGREMALKLTGETEWPDGT